MTTEVIVAVISLAGGLGAAVIAWLGRRDETTASASEALISGQSDRIDRLEHRLDELEVTLDRTREELRRFRSHSWDLRDALRRALAWIAEAVEHQNHPDTIAPPAPPDTAAWQELVDGPPRARNPPDVD